jgi:hypothetical protein
MDEEEEWRSRFCVMVVVTVFVRVVYEGEGPLVVETVAAFGLLFFGLLRW